MINKISSLRIVNLVLSLQLAMTGLVLMDSFIIHIPLLRELLGFIYLTFVPGFLLMNLFGIKHSQISETLVLSVGLSLSILMVTGMSLNFILPLFGIIPISTSSLFITYSIIILVFLVIFYNRVKYVHIPNMNYDHLSQVAFLCFLPIFSIFGTYTVNYTGNNTLLLMLFVIICAILILVAIGKITPSLYSLAIYMISISLLFHYSLISTYISGFDIHHEYFIANMVIESGHWNYSLPFNVNAMLSIVMLAPIYSFICNLELTWIFKIIYPLIYSFVPFCLYIIFSRLTNKTIAFYSCLFFMSVFVFYTEMLSLARQQIAELYLVLLIFVITASNLSKIQISSLFIIFSFSLAVSHYGLSYIFMLQFILVEILILFESKFLKLSQMNNSVLSPRMVTLFIVFTISWYLFFSSNTSFSSIVYVISNIIQNLASEFLNPEFAQGTTIILKSTVSPLHSILKYLHLLCQALITVGLITVIFKKVNFRIRTEYMFFSLVSFMLAIAGILVPYFGSSLNTTRLYHITLIFLAPFFTIGFFAVINVIFETINNKRILQLKIGTMHWHYYSVMSAFLIVFLLLNSGWLYEVTNDNPRSISLSKESMLDSNDVTDIVYYYTNGGYTPEQSVFGSKWLRSHGNSALHVYSDSLHKSHALQSYGMLLTYDELLPHTSMNEGSYLYLGYLNVHYGLMWSSYPKNHYSNVSDFKMFNSNISQVYSNGDSIIYWYD